MSRIGIIAAALILSIALTAGCTPSEVSTPGEPGVVPAPAPTETPAESPSTAVAWLDTPLTDAVTGEEFKLSDFKGQPVLLHAFAVW
jgi:cytochrome oxidase Cu insertion factor (SCO1/SenC/PrrC family)